MLLLTCLCLLVMVGVRGEGEVPPSPCPEVFQYVYDVGQWSGMLRVPVPDQPRRIVAVVSLFVVDALLPPEHPGELQLLQDEIKVKEKIRTNQMKTLVYVLELPLQDPLPIIDKIKVNRNIICEGPLVKARNRTKVTYTHRLNGLRQQSSGDDKEQRIKQQGRMLDKEFVANKFKEQQNDFNKEKIYNKLELMENEIVESVTQEEDMFPSKSGEEEEEEEEEEEDGGEQLDEEGDLEGRTGPELVDEADSSTTDFENESDIGDFDPNGEAEVLDVDSANTPDSAEDEDENEFEDDSSNEVGATSNNAVDPNKDAEMLEDSASGENIYEGGIFENEDDSKTEADSMNEDVEMIDNKVSEVESLKPKYPDPSFKTSFNGEEFEDFSDNELNPIYIPNMPDNVIYP